jgi:coenzyme PQQ precursor peptide PqqA
MDSLLKGYCFSTFAVLESCSIRLLVPRNRANPGGVNGNNQPEGVCTMSWEQPDFQDVSLSMEATSYANTSDETPTDPSFEN